MDVKVCLDTNIFIAVKNKEPEFENCKQILDSVENKQIEGVMPTIVIAEVLVGFYQNDEVEEANRFLSNAILNFIIIPLNAEISKESAYLRAQNNLKLPDAIVLASAIFSRSDFLITQDKIILKKLLIQKIAPKEFVKNHLEGKNP